MKIKGQLKLATGPWIEWDDDGILILNMAQWVQVLASLKFQVKVKVSQSVSQVSR